MQVLGIMGSARRDGNTNDLLDVLLQSAAAAGATTEKVVLADYRIEHIGNCQICKRQGRCINANDDFRPLMGKVFAATVIVLGSPVYWYSVAGRLKVFLDRWSCCIYEDNDAFIAKLKPKAGAVIAVQEETTYERAAHCIEALKMTIGYGGAEWLGYALGPGGKRGAALKHAPSVAAARELGRQAARFALKHAPPAACAELSRD